MEREDKIEELYARFLKNEATSAELERLFAWFAVAGEDELRHAIEIAMHRGDVLSADTERKERLEVIHQRIAAHIDAELIAPELQHSARVIQPAPSVQPKLTVFRWLKPAFRIAASVALFGLLGYFSYTYLFKTDDGSSIQPGCQCATLVLPEGRQIDLKSKSDTTLSPYRGVTIHKTADGELIYMADANDHRPVSVLNSIVTPLGGRYRIRLSDGTVVILNSGSKLEFPVGFHGAERRVKLEGEAYFEVTKDAEKPFIVVSGAGITEVLGTTFNVSNYAEDENVSTTLLEGKVKFMASATGNAVVLKPGEQVSLKRGVIDVQEVDAMDFTAWKDNRFVFRSTPLAQIMRQLSRWYNIEVDYSSLPDRKIYASISADVPLSEVLRMISLTSNIKFKVEGRRVSVMN